jgi:hypothetical protein
VINALSANYRTWDRFCDTFTKKIIHFLTKLATINTYMNVNKEERYALLRTFTF